jgi:hypothetical protein
MAALPRKPSPEKLEAFVRGQDAAMPADVLRELAAEHDDVRQRLARLALADPPKALAAANSSAAMSMRARASGSMQRHRPAGSRKFSGSGTTPAIEAANETRTCSMRSRDRNATRSPGARPLSANARARRRHVAIACVLAQAGPVLRPVPAC